MGREPCTEAARPFAQEASADPRLDQDQVCLITSSIASLKGLANQARYRAAKHGVVGLMRGLAVELAPHGIRVNTVHPSSVDTPISWIPSVVPTGQRSRPGRWTTGPVCFRERTTGL